MVVQSQWNSFFMVRKTLTNVEFQKVQAHLVASLLVLCSGITPGDAQRPYAVLGDRAGVNCLQCKHFNHCTISLVLELKKQK